MLAADPDREVRPSAPTPFDPHLDQVPDSVHIDRHERVVLENSATHVIRQECARVISRQRVAHLSQVVGPEREEVGELRNLISADRGARDLDHRANRELHPDLRVLLLHHGDRLLCESAQLGQLARVRNQRDHDLGVDLEPRRRQAVGGLGNGANLHGVNLGEADTQPAAAMTEHGVELVESIHLRSDLPHVGAECLCERPEFVIRMRKKLVQRRVEQPDRHRKPFHHPKDSLEIFALHGEQLRQRLLALIGICGENHLPHDENPAGLEEHVLGATQSDALGSKLPRHLGILGRVCVRADLENPRAIRPFHQLTEGATQLGRHRSDAPDQHLATRAIEGDGLTSPHDSAPDAHLSSRIVDVQIAAARHAALPHTARHHGGVRRHATARRQNALCRGHPVNVLGRGLEPHEHDLLTGLGLGFRQIG